MQIISYNIIAIAQIYKIITCEEFCLKLELQEIVENALILTLVQFPGMKCELRVTEAFKSALFLFPCVV